MQLDKIKGTLVDFNELEHVLDDMPRVGSWQIELRKANDDPMEVDELVLHVSLGRRRRGELRFDGDRAMPLRTEPNSVQIASCSIPTPKCAGFKESAKSFKEQKVVDRRLKTENRSPSLVTSPEK